MTRDRDARLVLKTLIDLAEWQLVRDRKRLGPADVAEKLKDIDLMRDLLGDDE